ncbi:cold shock protein (beta-ribbon, CspA family) [Pseudomonas sp. UC 17F4]|uniref:cold-shock protein n=1 Tax=Pseudomonas sp. UC 17F4 TaxID=1855328 RepID=UPI000881A311|nr:cold shock domain-containing protein [Pseudomonas sp. UC 17F4]SDQ62235.1 cold shock protein (beta-ribbon, CspA family) [Pseudomonas sp. UC 17F4]
MNEDSADTERHNGRIRRLTDKGFGFIQDVDGDIYFSSADVVSVRNEDLREGQIVTYTIEAGPKGRVAKNVTPL